jgi:hypothetical protein
VVEKLTGGPTFVNENEIAVRGCRFEDAIWSDVKAGFPVEVKLKAVPPIVPPIIPENKELDRKLVGLALVTLKLPEKFSVKLLPDAQIGVHTMAPVLVIDMANVAENGGDVLPAYEVTKTPVVVLIVVAGVPLLNDPVTVSALPDCPNAMITSALAGSLSIDAATTIDRAVVANRIRFMQFSCVLTNKLSRSFLTLEIRNRRANREK